MMVARGQPEEASAFSFTRYPTLPMAHPLIAGYAIGWGLLRDGYLGPFGGS